MTEPSAYELDAWRNLERYREHSLASRMQQAGSRIVDGTRHVGEQASEFVERHPSVRAATDKGMTAATKAARAVTTTAGKVVSSVPDDVTTWAVDAVGSIRQTGAKLSRAGLSSKRVVAMHQKRGHAVQKLADVRRLDLEQVHAVRGRGLGWYYPAAAALSGAGSGLAIAGGQLVAAASAGAAAAPSAGIVLGAFAADATVVLALSSRSVGHVALLHGYDPEEPAEKLFMLAVVNAGTALSASSKAAAMADISRLTQALIRGKTWKVLNQSVLSRVAGQAAKVFETRLTKAGLGKIVPAAGILVGGSLNWATVEGIVDAAEVAYRRRFLLEKYPHLADADVGSAVAAEDSESAPDVTFSLLDEIAEEGGPDLR